ncbi:MAG TPA: ATP-binding cassette domain-containing protein [Planctomycetes bacterium]|nr:ATP-binding cassette domain-containing protein [Planctomycetota bacterium]
MRDSGDIGRHLGCGLPSRGGSERSTTDGVKACSPTGTPLLSLSRVHHAYEVDRRHVTAVHDLELDIHAGEVLALVGPQGSGKSTTLNLVAGIETPLHGRVLRGGRPVPAEELQPFVVLLRPFMERELSAMAACLSSDGRWRLALARSLRAGARVIACELPRNRAASKSIMNALLLLARRGMGAVVATEDHEVGRLAHRRVHLRPMLIPPPTA